MATKKTTVATNETVTAQDIFAGVGVLATVGLVIYLGVSSLMYFNDVTTAKDLVLNGNPRYGIYSVEKLTSRLESVANASEFHDTAIRRLDRKVDCLITKGTWTWDDHANTMVCK